MFISGYANTGKKFSIAFIKKKKLSREKTQNSSFRIMIKREILTKSRSLVHEACSVISSCFAVKMISKNTGFCHLKCQLKRKKIDSMFLKIFQVSADEEMGK